MRILPHDDRRGSRRLFRGSTRLFAGLAIVALANPAWADVPSPIVSGSSATCGAIGAGILSLLLVGTGFLALHSRRRRK